MGNGKSEFSFSFGNLYFSDSVLGFKSRKFPFSLQSLIVHVFTCINR